MIFANEMKQQLEINRTHPTSLACKQPVCHLALIADMMQNDRTIWPFENSLYLSQNGGTPEVGEYRVFKTDQELIYEPFCDDFGPMNVTAIFRFIEILDHELKMTAARNSLLYSVEPGAKAWTNACFLLGCYMILKHDIPALEMLSCFRDLTSLSVVYRDASRSDSLFGLEIIDCWQGIEKAKQRGWIGLPSKETSGKWGMIDPDAYMHYDDPVNADLHEIIPGKLIIFRGPKDLGGRDFVNNYSKGVFSYRDFTPSYYVDILKELGVDTTVRLNAPQYDANVFISNGFRHMDIIFEEGSSPIPQAAAVSKYFKLMDESKGCVAIHGKYSFGRAGTLAALYLMRTYAFTAREAIAWVRIMRPGCIIGSQQNYLCSVEQSISKVMVSIFHPSSPKMAVMDLKNCGITGMRLRHVLPLLPATGAIKPSDQEVQIQRSAPAGQIHAAGAESFGRGPWP